MIDDNSATTGPPTIDVPVDHPADSKLLDKVMNHDLFGPHLMKNKREIVLGSLIFSGALFSFIILAMTVISFYIIYQEKTNTVKVDSDIIGILNSALWILFLFATGIIGSSVFGSAYDASGFRSSILGLVERLKK